MPDIDEFLTRGENERIAALSEEDIVLFDPAENIPNNINIRTKAYIALLCTRGKAECRVNDKVFVVGANDVFFCHPNVFLENAMATLDFKCCGMLMSQKLFESMLTLGDTLFDAQMVVLREPVVHLEPEEAKLMLDDFKVIQSKLSAPPRPHRKETIKFLIQSMIYEFFDCISPKLQMGNYSFTSAESLFSRFMRLLTEDSPRHRDVGHYAGKLCVSSKYLSAVCKQLAGDTASTIINRYAIENIKTRLRTSTKSVKEIAVECGFENLSFFGKYVRRTLGMSPRDYRREMRQPAVPGEE